MAQITSREELEDWLKDKPADWAQVIAARAALRVLPIALVPTYKWTPLGLQAIFRCALMFWGIKSITTDNITHTMLQSLRAIEINTGGYIPVDWDEDFTHGDEPAADAAYHAIYAATIFDAPEAATAAYDALYSSDAIPWDEDTGDSIVTIWESISNDALWLSRHHDFSAAIKLTGESLWLSYPVGLRISDWKKKLLTLDPTYQVWIDWYNRRIEGHDAAFDIPGDYDRTEDKAILARLADATNEDFWDKGATHVNTTLQSWIDEAREQAAIDYVTSGALLNLGSEAELAARDELTARLASVEDALAGLKDQLASLTQTGHGGIGHNQPENATSLRDDEIITLKRQVASLETLLTGVQTQLAKPVPDVGQLVQDAPKLNRWGYGVMWLASVTSEMVAEGFEKEIGAAGAKGLVAGLVAIVLAALAAFSHYFYTYWIPLLIG